MDVCLFYEEPKIYQEIHGVIVLEKNNTFHAIKKKYVEIKTNNRGCTLSTYNRYRKVEMSLSRKEGDVSNEDGVFPVYYDVALVAGRDKYTLRFKQKEFAMDFINRMVSKDIAIFNS